MEKNIKSYTSVINVIEWATNSIKTTMLCEIISRLRNCSSILAMYFSLDNVPDEQLTVGGALMDDSDKETPQSQYNWSVSGQWKVKVFPLWDHPIQLLPLRRELSVIVPGRTVHGSVTAHSLHLPALATCSPVTMITTVFLLTRPQSTLQLRCSRTLSLIRFQLLQKLL